MSSDESIEEEKTPNVDNFMKYFPWAVGKFSTVGVNVVVRKMIELELVSSSFHSINFNKKFKITSEARSRKSVRRIVSDSFTEPEATTIPTITITANYNKVGNNLIGLKFEKGITIPRTMVYILGLIIKFHTKLVSVTFLGNADQFAVYEMSKILPLSNINEVCLDGSYVKEGNFHILLGENCNLKVLSLARCSITDVVLKLIMDKLVFPMPAGFTLNILNLSSNRITDVGAKYVADALRLNRRLYYLNLANNSITEDGAEEILSIFLDFPTTEAEVIYSRQLRYKYLKEKHELVNELVARQSKSYVNHLSKQTLSSTSLGVKQKRKKKVMLNIVRSKLLYDSLMQNVNKATNTAQLALGIFQNPLGGQQTKAGVIYSAGNNTLRSLNLAYNNLSFNTVKKLLQVLRYQKISGRKPIGLINVNIEGNHIPVTCDELREINTLLMVATKAELPPHYMKGRLSKAPSKSSRVNLLARPTSERKIRKFH